MQGIFSRMIFGKMIFVFMFSVIAWAKGDVTNLMYSIQVGSFRSVENAGNLSDSLNRKGLDAFFFKQDGMYKVRFGDYESKEAARRAAISLKNQGLIDDFYIVSPDTYLINKENTQDSSENIVVEIEEEPQNLAQNTPKDSAKEEIIVDIEENEPQQYNRDNKVVANPPNYDTNTSNYASSNYAQNDLAQTPQSTQNEPQKIELSPVRQKIIDDANGYLGVPYKWGGDSSSGFDSNGLVRSVYKLNGLNLPRTTREQSMAGKYVPFKDAQPGDLVFFIVNNKQSINHVGIYIGDGKFIHAPGKGKAVQVDSLQDEYWKKIYKGARKYF